MTRPFEVAHLSAGLTTQSRSLWAQVLTGKDWTESGCAGYCIPEGSLRNTQVAFETDLKAPVELLSRVKGAETLCVSIPLVEPRDRHWLSDGTHQQQSSGFSRTLVRNGGARPFYGLGTQLSRKQEAIKRVFDHDLQRWQLVRSVLEDRSFSTVLYRFSVFDAQGHLYGMDDSVLVADVMADSRRLLTEVVEFFWDKYSHVSVLSTHDFVPCVQVVDVNHVLSAHGLLAYEGPGEDPRQEALNAIGVHQAVALPKRLNTAKTKAAAITDGVIYVNDRKRFHDGVVAHSDVASVSNCVKQLLESYFEGMAAVVEVSTSGGPDVVFHIDGFDYCGPLFPELKRQRSLAVHGRDGFIATKGALVENGQRLALKDACALLVNS